jgi:hypothetical protein
MSGYVEKHLMPQHYQGMLCNFMHTTFIQILLAPNFYIKKLIGLLVGGFVCWSQPTSGSLRCHVHSKFLQATLMFVTKLA